MPFYSDKISYFTNIKDKFVSVKFNEANGATQSISVDGEKIMLRCAMSTAKRKILNKFLGKNCMLMVTYGRMSKIVVKYDGAESDMYRLNQRV